VLKTVTAASGTGHNIGTATSFQRGHLKLCSLIYFTAKSLYMFRVSHHPSSGVLKTVTAASGTGHNIGTATSFQRGHLKLCSLIYFIAKSLYMFRVTQHPSSGVLKTVTRGYSYSYTYSDFAVK
jgi:hypothetical protein